MVFKRRTGSRAVEPKISGTPQKEENMLGRDRDTTYTPGENSYSSLDGGNGTVLSKDAEFKGSMNFQTSLRIDGKFEGEITSPGTIHVGQSGELQAEVRVGNSIVEGKVTGNIIAQDKLELRSTAKLFGDIKAARLVINEGVVFVGKCEVNPSSDKIEVLRPENRQEQDSEEPAEEEVGASK
jgi:cytoskeletal protein CcmA (bactofilin family)